MAHWLKMKPEEKKLNTKPQPQKWCTQRRRTPGSLYNNMGNNQ